MFLVLQTNLKYDGQRTEKKSSMFRSYSSKADIAANFSRQYSTGQTVLDPQKLSAHHPELQGGEVIAINNGSEGTVVIEVLHMDQVAEI